VQSGASGSCKNRRHGDRREGWSYGFLPRVHRRPKAHAGSTGEGKGRRRRSSPVGLKGEGLGAVAGRSRCVEAVQEDPRRWRRRSGRRLGEAPGGGDLLLVRLRVASSPSSRGSSPSSPPPTLSHSQVRRRRKETKARVARVLGWRPAGSYGRRP
jgi:hypothetical protein